MQIFFLIVLGLYSALVLFRFGVNMWSMLTLDAKRYDLMQLAQWVKTRQTYRANHVEYAQAVINVLVKYFIIRFLAVSVLWVLVIKFV